MVTVVIDDEECIVDDEDNVGRDERTQGGKVQDVGVRKSWPGFIHFGLFDSTGLPCSY